MLRLKFHSSPFEAWCSLLIFPLFGLLYTIMHYTSSAVVVTLLMAIFTSSPGEPLMQHIPSVIHWALTFLNSLVNSQETLTLVDFGDFSNGGDGRISASIQRFVPVGTANGGSETTFAFEEVDVFSTTDSNGSPTYPTRLYSQGTVIASASGFQVSFTVAAIPTEIAQGERESIACSSINSGGGECTRELVVADASKTMTQHTDVTGPPAHTQLIPIGSPSQSAGGAGNNDKKNSALGHSSNGIVIVGIAVGTLLGFMRVF
jgi:hypothetical protein